MEATRRIKVSLPARAFNLEESLEILRNVLGKAGCGACYSGLEISFVNEVELVVRPSGEVVGGVRGEG
ncbi:MAG: hypothetical protein ACRDY0_10265 [Acidimicrobiales bacterium]